MMTNIQEKVLDGLERVEKHNVHFWCLLGDTTWTKTNHPLMCLSSPMPWTFIWFEQSKNGKKRRGIKKRSAVTLFCLVVLNSAQIAQRFFLFLRLPLLCIILGFPAIRCSTEPLSVSLWRAVLSYSHRHDLFQSVLLLRLQVFWAVCYFKRCQFAQFVTCVWLAFFCRFIPKRTWQLIACIIDGCLVASH